MTQQTLHLATPADVDGQGLVCPGCGSTAVGVVDSRPVEHGRRRRQECLGCGTRFTTHEYPTTQIEHWRADSETLDRLLRLLFELIGKRGGG